MVIITLPDLDCFHTQSRTHTIYREDALQREGAVRRGEQLYGIVVGILRIADLVDEALAKARARGIEVRLYDGKEEPTRQLLYSRPSLVQTGEEGGATEGAAIHLPKAGVPTVVMGVPTRHIHSHNGILSRKDFDNTVRLVTAVVQKLDRKTVDRLTSF